MIPTPPQPATPLMQTQAPPISKPPIEQNPATMNQVQTNQMQVQALGGPAPAQQPGMGAGGAAPPGGPRLPPVTPHRQYHGGPGDDPGYMADLARRQHQPTPGYHGFVMPKRLQQPQPQATPQVGLLGPPVQAPPTGTR